MVAFRDADLVAALHEVNSEDFKEYKIVMRGIFERILVDIEVPSSDKGYLAAVPGNKNKINDAVEETIKEFGSRAHIPKKDLDNVKKVVRRFGSIVLSEIKRKGELPQKAESSRTSLVQSVEVGDDLPTQTVKAARTSTKASPQAGRSKATSSADNENTSTRRSDAETGTKKQGGVKEAKDKKRTSTRRSNAAAGAENQSGAEEAKDNKKRTSTQSYNARTGTEKQSGVKEAKVSKPASAQPQDPTNDAEGQPSVEEGVDTSEHAASVRISDARNNAEDQPGIVGQADTSKKTTKGSHDTTIGAVHQSAASGGPADASVGSVDSSRSPTPMLCPECEAAAIEEKAYPQASATKKGNNGTISHDCQPAPDMSDTSLPVHTQDNRQRRDATIGGLGLDKGGRVNTPATPPLEATTTHRMVPLKRPAEEVISIVAMTKRRHLRGIGAEIQKTSHKATTADAQELEKDMAGAKHTFSTVETRKSAMAKPLSSIPGGAANDTKTGDPAVLAKGFGVGVGSAANGTETREPAGLVKDSGVGIDGTADDTKTGNLAGLAKDSGLEIGGAADGTKTEIPAGAKPMTVLGEATRNRTITSAKDLRILQRLYQKAQEGR